MKNCEKYLKAPNKSTQIRTLKLIPSLDVKSHEGHLKDTQIYKRQNFMLNPIVDKFHRVERAFNNNFLFFLNKRCDAYRHAFLRRKKIQVKLIEIIL